MEEACHKSAQWRGAAKGNTAAQARLAKTTAPMRTLRADHANQLLSTSPIILSALLPFPAAMTLLMPTTMQLAKHLREVCFGGNWTEVNFRDTLADVTWQQATEKVNDFNTIATLLFHTHYYLSRVQRVLEGGTLDATDADAFLHPPIASETDWQKLLEQARADAELFARAVEDFPDSRLDDVFVAEKYGTYHRNLLGVIEHLHYHLGQIVFLKRMVVSK